MLRPQRAGRRLRCRGAGDQGGARRQWLALTGRKIWTSNAPVADYCIVFAITDPERAAARKGGISAFLVPTSSPGFEVQRIIKLFGHIGGDEAELRLEDVRVEPWQLVGELHQGFAAALYGVSLGRIYNSARAVGYGRWALEKALDYAQQRKAFGKAIAEYQGVTFPLAESATELHGAHLMGLNVATLLDQGAPAVKELAMAKAYSVQVGYRAVDRAMQTHGAMGFTNELGLHQPGIAAHRQCRRRHQRDPQPLDRAAPAERRYRTVIGIGPMSEPTFDHSAGLGDCASHCCHVQPRSRHPGRHPERPASRSATRWTSPSARGLLAGDRRGARTAPTASTTATTAR